MDIFTVIKYAASLCAVIFIFTPHEFAHAYVAYKNGDPTAKLNGRCTLNPIKHIDPIGFVSCMLIGFGWAKPVPINPSNFHKRKKGLFLTAIAGVVTNYIIAFFAFALLCVFHRYVYWYVYINMPHNSPLFYLVFFVEYFLSILFSYSLCIVVFNLLPLYPLDGFRIIEAFTRQVNPVQRFLRNYGQMILIILIVESFICNLLSSYVASWVDNFNILNYILTFARDIIGYPIQKAWDWILYL